MELYNDLHIETNITKAFKEIDDLELSENEVKVKKDILLLLIKKNFVDFEGWSLLPDITFDTIFFEEKISFSKITDNILDTIYNDSPIFYGGT